MMLVVSSGCFVVYIFCLVALVCLSVLIFIDPPLWWINIYIYVALTVFQTLKGHCQF